MTDPRRLLARLNPSTIRYDTLPGGVPDVDSARHCPCPGAGACGVGA
ncbi:hypothetical protein [Xylella fastidiosa]|nr:hypothetical protein [Xylella fastidiosa]